MPQAFVRLTAASSPEFEQLIAIYQDAIDPSEQKTAAELAAMLADRRYMALVSITDAIVSGFSISYFPDNAEFWLLEYMAVASPIRSSGLGAAIFNETYRAGAMRSCGAIMLLEVDQPGGSTNASNDTAARFRFYRRMGCRQIAGLNYVLPLKSNGAPPPMMLLTYSLPSVNTVSKSKIKNWLTILYGDVYHCSRTDVRIAAMTAHLPETLLVLPF